MTSSNGSLEFPVRDKVQKAGLLTTVRNARALLRREASEWIENGCRSPAPNVVKFNVVRSYVEEYGTPHFIETGTYLGSMVEYIAKTGAQCHTIEIDEATYRRAQDILGKHDNIELILGDSEVELPKLLERLEQPATFWLDGHYSGSFTGRGKLDAPISAELDAILAHKVQGHVVLIDDARCFVGEGGYPPLGAFLASFDDHPLYRAWVSADIIRIEPRKK